MGLYGDYIFPHLIDFAMSKPELAIHRARVLAAARGKTLEIGFGTGLNLAHYPGTIREIVAVDVSPGMKRLAVKRSADAEVKVDYQVLDASRLPFADGTFDTVVSTWTLCSIGPVAGALREIRRVLAPGGQFLFLEHGASRDRRVAAFQRFLEPVNRLMACGCHLTRDFRRILTDEGFTLRTVEEYYLESVPRTHGYMYEGIAV